MSNDKQVISFRIAPELKQQLQSPEFKAHIGNPAELLRTAIQVAVDGDQTQLNQYVSQAICSSDPTTNAGKQPQLVTYTLNIATSLKQQFEVQLTKNSLLKQYCHSLSDYLRLVCQYYVTKDHMRNVVSKITQNPLVESDQVTYLTVLRPQGPDHFDVFMPGLPMWDFYLTNFSINDDSSLSTAIHEIEQRLFKMVLQFPDLQSLPIEPVTGLTLTDRDCVVKHVITNDRLKRLKKSVSSPSYFNSDTFDYE